MFGLVLEKKSNVRYLRDKNFCWDPGIFKYLGIRFSVNTKEIPSLNFDGKFQEIQNLLNKWKRRQLTPFGKIAIIKTLAISKITHLFMSIPDPSKKFLCDLNKLFYEFLWNCKPSRISKDVVCKSYDEGGLKMLNVYTFLSTMKINCLKRTLMSTDNQSRLAFAMYPHLEYIKHHGSHYCKKLLDEMKNDFWKDVLYHFHLFQIKCTPKNVVDFCSEPLFDNMNILVNGRAICYKSYIDNGIYQVSHLLKANGEFLSFGDLCIKYPLLQTNFLHYHGLVNAVRQYKNYLNIDCLQEYFLCEQKAIRILCEGNAKLQSFLNHNEVVPAGTKKWNESFENLNWKIIFIKCNKTTMDSKLRWFQTRLLHRLLPTNRYLYLRRIKDCRICSFCGIEEETIRHLFWSCDFVKRFWANLQSLLVEKCPLIHNLVFTEEMILFGHKENMYCDKVFDLIILIAKYYIYSNKFTSTIPSVFMFIHVIKRRYDIEKYLSINVNKFHNFQLSWFPYKDLIL